VIATYGGPGTGAPTVQGAEVRKQYVCTVPKNIENGKVGSEVAL